MCSNLCVFAPFNIYIISIFSLLSLIFFTFLSVAVHVLLLHLKFLCCGTNKGRFYSIVFSLTWNKLIFFQPFKHFSQIVSLKLTYIHCFQLFKSCKLCHVNIFCFLQCFFFCFIIYRINYAIMFTPRNSPSSDRLHITKDFYSLLLKVIFHSSIHYL